MNIIIPSLQEFGAILKLDYTYMIMNRVYMGSESVLSTACHLLIPALGHLIYGHNQNDGNF